MLCVFFMLIETCSALCLPYSPLCIRVNLANDQITMSSMTVRTLVFASGRFCGWTCWDSRSYYEALNRTDQVCFVQYTALSLNTSLDFVQQFNFSRSGLVAQGPGAKPDTIYTI